MIGSTRLARDARCEGIFTRRNIAKAGRRMGRLRGAAVEDGNAVKKKKQYKSIKNRE